MDTADWDIEEVGIYTRLLFYQWVNGFIPDDMVRISRIAGCSVKKVSNKWNYLSPKFTQKGEGKLVNLRLEESRIKQQEFINSSIESGRRGGLKTQETRRTQPSDPLSDPTKYPTPDPSSEIKALQSSSSSSVFKDKTYTEDFLNFWDAYPKKIGKKAAFKSWQNAKDKPPMIIIINAISNQKRSDQWLNSRGQYIPNPATWLNQGRWDDETNTRSGNPPDVKQTFPNCPICKKETTKADIDKLGSCPSCFKPMPEEKLKELLGNIGKKI